MNDPKFVVKVKDKYLTKEGNLSVYRYMAAWFYNQEDARKFQQQHKGSLVYRAYYGQTHEYHI